MTVLVLTDRKQARAPLAHVVAAAVDGGARSVVLREKDLPRPQRVELAEALRAILEPVGGRLIVAGPDPLGGNAVHLATADPAPAGVGYLGRSCHDADELSRLSTEDYAIVSPVFPTASKPGYGPALGLFGLARLASRTAKPVFGLGGLESPAHAIACVAAGAAGVALMGAVMRAPDPAATVAAFVEEVGA
jgi:thiamine-phosphate pyrophosphorylase